jgi:hypothetical protein
MTEVKVKLINYFDVWGNEEEGFEVNNLCEECQFTLPNEFTNEELLESLKDVGFILPEVKMEQIRFDDMFDYGKEFYQADNGYPIGRIEYI